MTILLTSFNVLNQLEVDVNFTYNPYGFLASDLFEVGARVNPKRSFLFVSKLIGKHLDVHPDVPKATGMLLAELFIREIEGLPVFDTKPLVDFIKTGKKDQSTEEVLQSRALLAKEDGVLFIGFAETATGLGHAVFSSFDEASFIHTTREDLMMKSVFDFEEEHSHAVDHRCYLLDESIIKDSKHVVLIDDEMTTGKTSLNLIRSLHHVYPKERYTILCLLDWRNKEEKKAYEQLEKELGVKISVVSLTQGSMKLSKEAFFEYEEQVSHELKEIPYRSIDSSMIPKVEVIQSGTINFVKYPLYTGRFGLTSNEHDKVEESAKNLGKFLAPLRRGRKTLVLGMGEFMYIPSRIASYMGDGVVHKTTTRSPIYPFVQEGYPIHDRLSFKDEQGVTYYSYNLKKNHYDEVMVISENFLSKDMRGKMASCFAEKGISEITFVSL